VDGEYWLTFPWADCSGPEALKISRDASGEQVL